MSTEHTKQAVEDLAGSTVVITGASSGIGKATAIEFARRKANLVLVARREHSLHDLVQECQAMGIQALAMPADVTDENALKTTAKTAMDTFGRIDVWVNDAGVMMFGRLEEAPLDALRKVIDTNLFGYINGARAVIPYFRQQGKGVLINMSSLAGKMAQPYTGAYNASEFAINGLSESLRMELEDMPNVHVCTVIAPSIDTPLFQHGANFTGRAVKPMSPVYPAQRVARTIVRLAEHPEREVVVGLPARIMLFVHSLMPARMERLMAKRAASEYFQDKPATESQGNLFRPMEQWSGISGEWLDSGRMSRARRSAFTLGFLGFAGALAFGYAKMCRVKKRRFSLVGG